MRKTSRSKRIKTPQKQKAPQQTQAEQIDAKKRKFMRSARNYGIGALVVAGLGIPLAQYVGAEIHEHDLSRVGNGTPTIVQIHDPQCRLCLALQKETRKALTHFDDDKLDYVVANIRTAEGREFAGRHLVQHVTLLLFDGKGNLKQVLRGQRPSHEIRASFTALLR